LTFKYNFQDDPPLLISVKEEVPIGTVVGTLEAVDEDIGENAAIDYAITGTDFVLERSLEYFLTLPTYSVCIHIK
jgi:hypothetical protein